MTDRRALAVLIVAHLAVVAIVQPRGEFPLNDDWAYAHSVQWLLSEGRIRLSGWIAMNLVPQTLAGGVVAALLGFSFEALRHLTQVVAVLAAGTAYAWFRVSRLEPLHALVASLALLSFPAWPVLANSFMTDLYGLALGLPAAIFFVRALERDSRADLLVASAFSIAGVLERQVVLVLPLAFAVAHAWTRRPFVGRSFLVAAAPFVATAAAAAAYHAYLQHGPGVPEGHRMAYGRLLPAMWNALTNANGGTGWALSNAATIGGYLGLFSAGWLAWWGVGERPRTVAVVLAVAALIAIAAFVLDWFPPYRAHQVIDAAGIGPFLLYDAVRGNAPLDRSAGIAWRIAAVAAAFGSAALLALLATTATRLARRDVSPAVAFNATVIAAYLGPFIVTDYFDRYLLFVLPFVFALCTQAWPSVSAFAWRRPVALAWVAGVIALSAAATRDYFSWNRARWDAIRTAERLGANASAIDGGFEHGGLSRYETRAASVPEGKGWYWVQDDLYVVSFTGVAGYEEVGAWPVARWLPRTPREVKLLRRKP
jgi:hypothetical protein